MGYSRSSPCELVLRNVGKQDSANVSSGDCGIHVADDDSNVRMPEEKIARALGHATLWRDDLERELVASFP